MMQGETFVRKDMTEYKNMMNGVHNVTSCNNSVSLEKPNESNKKIFFDEKIAKVSKGNCNNSNVSVENLEDTSIDKTIDNVNVGSNFSAGRYTNSTSSNNNNGNTSNLGNYWMNTKSNRLLQKKTNIDIEDGKNTTSITASYNNNTNKVDANRNIEENKNCKVHSDLNSNFMNTSSNMEHLTNNGTIGLKGNLGNYKSKKSDEDTIREIDNESKMNEDIGVFGNAKNTSKNNMINESDNATLLNDKERTNENSINVRKNYGYFTVEKNKETEANAVGDTYYYGSSKDTNGKVGANSTEGVCNGYSNGTNVHRGENMSNGCTNAGNTNTNEVESGSTFRVFKGNAKISGNDKHSNSINSINMNHIKGVTEDEPKQLNGDIKSREKNSESVENKTNEDVTILERNGDVDCKNYGNNNKSRNNNKNNMNSNNTNKKGDDHKNKNSTFSSESGNSTSEAPNATYKLNSASSNSYHNISSISSLNADAPEFVPSTKSAQNSLPFNKLLWNNYYQDLSSPFSSVANNSVINPVNQSANVGNNASISANTTGSVHNSLMSTSEGIESPLLSTGVREGGGTGDGTTSSNNLLNVVNSNNNSNTTSNNNIPLNSTNLPISNNSSGLISNTSNGIINRTEPSNMKHNPNILSNNRNAVGGSSNSGITPNIVSGSEISGSSVGGIKHGMHEGNVTASTTTNNATTNATTGGIGNVPNIGNMNGIGNVTNVGGSGVPTIGNIPNIHSSPTMNNPQTMHNSPAIVTAVPGGGGGSHNNCNFMNPSLIHSNNNLRTTSFMSSSENSTPFHHIGSSPHAHQNFQPNNSLIHPPNFCVNSPYLINNHHNTIPTHQSAMFTPPLSYGNSIPPTNGHPEITFPQAASMYGGFPNNPNVMGNNNLTSQKNAGLNMTPYNFLPCVMPQHPQLQPNTPMNINSMEHHCIANSANAHMKIPYSHGNQANRRNMFNHFNNNASGNTNVTSMHNGANLNEANFEHSSNMNAVMSGNMNYGFNSFNANQNNSIQLNNESSNMHMNPAVGNNMPLNSNPGVICLGAPLHMNNSANMAPSHHHMNNVNTMENIGTIGNVNNLNNSMHMGNIHMNHNVMMNNNTNMNKQKRNISYSERNKQYNNYRDNKNTVKNNMMNINNTMNNFNHFSNTGQNNANVNQNISNNQNNNVINSNSNNNASNNANTNNNNNNNNMGGNNNTKQENKKHNKYNVGNNFNQNFNLNSVINNVSSNTKNMYSKNMKVENYINNNSGNNNREESNSGVNANMNYYHSNTNSSINCGLSIHNTGLLLKDVNSEVKELNDNFSEHNNNAYNSEAPYSNKGKNYNLNNANAKNKIINTANNNTNGLNSNTNTRTNNMLNNMNLNFGNEGMNEKGRHNNINNKGDKNNKEDYKSNRNNYANNASNNNNAKNNMGNVNITNKFNEDKNVAHVNKKGEMGKEKSNKQNELSYKKNYSEIGSTAGNNIVNNMDMLVNGNSNEQCYGGEFQNNTENKRNVRNIDNTASSNNNKMNDKKMKNEDDKKIRKKNIMMNMNGSVSTVNIRNNAENENVSKMIAENNVSMASSDMANVNNVNFNNNNNTSNNKGGNYNIKNNKEGFERKIGEFTSWAKIAKTNLNKKKEKISNVNVNNINAPSGGNRNRNNINNNFVEVVKEKDREKGLTQNVRGNEAGFTQNEAMNKERQKKNEEEKEKEREKEGQHKVARKNQEKKYDNNIRSKKMNYPNKDYNIEKDIKDKQKSKYDNRKGEINERKLNNTVAMSNMMNNMINNVNNTSSNYVPRSREKVKIQNVEIREIDEKLLNSVKLDEKRIGKKNNENKNVINASMNYVNEDRSENSSERTQLVDVIKNKDILEKEKEREKLNGNTEVFQNEKSNLGAALVPVPGFVTNKNEESFTKREGPRETSSSSPSPKESYSTSQENKWNKSNENVSKKFSGSNVTLNKVNNVCVPTNTSGSLNTCDKNSSSLATNSKNSIWDGKTSFAEVAKRKPQRVMREVKSELVINDGKNSIFNKNDKGNRKEHSRYSSNATMREKGLMSVGDSVTSSKEIKKRNNEDKEERANVHTNTLEVQDQENESVIIDNTKAVKEKHTVNVVENVKIEKEVIANIPVVENKDKIIEVKSHVRNTERKDWKDGKDLKDAKDDKYKNIKNERKEKNKDVDEEKEKLERVKGATMHLNKGSNKISNVEINLGEYKFNEKEKTNVLKNKEDFNKTESTVENNVVFNKKENVQEDEQSEDISKKKKKKKKFENEEETKMTEETESNRVISTIEQKVVKEEKHVMEEIKHTDKVEENESLHVVNKEALKVEKVETKKDIKNIIYEKESVEHTAVENTVPVQLKEEKEIKSVNKEDSDIASAASVSMKKENVANVDTEQIEKEIKTVNKTIEIETEKKVVTEEKEPTKKIELNVISEEKKLQESIETTKKEEKTDDVQTHKLIKEEIQTEKIEKREDSELSRLENKKTELEEQQDKVISDKSIKEAEKKVTEECNTSSTTNNNDNNNNNNNNSNNNNNNNNTNTNNNNSNNNSSEQINEKDNNTDDVPSKENNNKKDENDRKGGEKDGESGKKGKEEKDARIIKMRMERKYTKNELLLVYVSHNWNKDAHDYFKPHAGGRHSVLINYITNKNCVINKGGNNNNNNSNHRDSDIGSRNSMLMSNEFKNMSSNMNAHLSGSNNASGNSGNNMNRSSHANSNTGINMNNNNNGGKRYGMNLARSSVSSLPGVAGEEEDWRKNSVSKNIINSLFSNNASNNILFNNNAFGANLMLDSFGQNNSSGINNNITNNLLMKSVNTTSDWRKTDGEKLKGFFDATRVKEPVGGNWRKSTPTKSFQNSWLAKQNQLKADKYTCLMRKLRGILNRLTFEKFDLLYEEMINVNFSKTEEIIGLLKLIFEKAVSQHHFVQMYVQLCMRLSNHFINVKLENSEDFSFRKLLINQCQDSFESYLKPIEYPPNIEGDDKFEFEQKYKNKVRGNMLFVGELVKSGIISISVVFVCIQQLLNKREDYIKIKNDTNVGNLHLEALCMFLNTIGEIIDTHEKIKREKQDTKDNKDNGNTVATLYKTLNDLVNDERIVFRVRCLIKDVIENRNEKWNKKFAHKLEGPTTLSDLHDKVLKETIDHNTKGFSNNNSSGNNANYHDRLSNNLNNMRNNLLRGNTMNNSNYMNSSNNYMNVNTSNANANNSNNMNTRGMGGMKNLDGMKNMMKMAQNLSKNKNVTKFSEENNKGVQNDNNANNNTSSGTSSYYDFMAKSHLGDFGRNNGFINEGNRPLRNMENSRMMNMGNSNANSNTIMGKDKNDTKSCNRSYRMGKGNDLMKRNDISSNHNDAFGDNHFIRGVNATSTANENSGKLNFMNRNMKDTTAAPAIPAVPAAHTANNNEDKITEEDKQKDEGELKKNLTAKINNIIRIATNTDDWELLTAKFEEISILPQSQDMVNEIILELTLKNFARNENLEKSVNYFNWIIGSIVLKYKYLNIEAFKNTWKTFMLREDEKGYECTKEDYPLLPTIAKNFVMGIEQCDKNGMIYDKATLEEIKKII